MTYDSPWSPGRYNPLCLADKIQSIKGATLGFFLAYQFVASRRHLTTLLCDGFKASADT